MGSFLPFALPDIGEEEINEVLETLKSGWLTTGPKTKQFEQDFVEFLGGQVKAIAVNSATAGLHLALEALGIQPGDEVITPTYTFTATAEVVRYLGADPILVDINPDTFNIDPNQIEKAITPRTKAIIPVHFGGLACEMATIMEIARHHGLKVVEDAAHAIPTTYQGRLVGNLDTDATVYSFYANKPIATGEGGMIVTPHQEIADRCRVMRLHGINRDVFDRYTSSKPSWYYEVIAPGFKYNMGDIAAALGIHQLKKAYMFQEKRRAIAEYYREQLADLPLLLPSFPPFGDLHAWHLYVIRLLKGDRAEFIAQMSAQGIGCSVHYIPLHIHPYWRDTYQLSPEDFPKALATYQQAVSLPIYTKMTRGDQDRVINTIREILIK
ncbi:DegT/DnrJ/EryC1/StrS aminotransferase family protein [Gloeocapsa sp. PCC 73106]|uniref:DegT/DnrJ/EryC1/StrS family aminotransferase n=1 Tax=Gloeocapsa sp. PCC 73106 TaxID=102232 RepID=UPI0002AC065D|nr:DegT/DnrJ/EryC1/StrS family aminotransferase [Gloeocapsa sp. PCC 73106]ELR99053.1 putative PLP-dependent enzyme possibly involved in cell wall biogenesis [Gloeocapsa sp. PCC 73106]